MRSALILTLICTVTSCARPDYSPGWWPGHIIVSAGAQPGYAIKRVIEKLESGELLGEDGSICHTSAERFADTSVGSWIDCTWALPAPDGDELLRREA